MLTTVGPGISAPEAAAALTATARPVPGLVHGRIDAAAAARSLTALQVFPIPDQVVMLSGRFAHQLTTAFVLRGTRFVLRLRLQRQRGCTMTFASADSLYQGAPAGSGELVASASDATPGRYTLNVRCAAGSANAYTVSLYRSTVPSFAAG